MKPAIRTLVFLSLSALLLFSCSEGLYTIFDNVANDNLIDDNELDNTLSITGMVKVGSRYYISAGKVRSREAAGTNWNAFTVADGYHNSIATDGTFLYVTVLLDNDSSGLYRFDPASPSTTTVAVTLANVKNIGRIKNFGGATSYITARLNDDTYTIFEVSGTTATDQNLAAAAPILDFTDNGGLCYVTGHSVFVAGTDVAPNSEFTYSSIYSFSGLLYLGTNNGALYQSIGVPSSAADWTARTGFKYDKNGNSLPVRFTSFSGVTGAPNRLFVGSRTVGFYQITPDVSFTVTRFADASKAELYNGAVESFFIDADSDPLAPEVFCCTISAGLWHNSFTLADATWGDTWTRE